MDSFLVLRGIKTLHLRMQRHCENGKIIAAFLKEHPKVSDVYWPGFESHPNHEVAKKQMEELPFYNTFFQDTHCRRAQQLYLLCLGPFLHQFL